MQENQIHLQDSSELWKKTAGYFARAKSVLFITGAGLSADSGLPTYRGIGGLYENQDTDEGIPIEEALSGHTFKTNPRLTWKYLSLIANACEDAGYNEGHRFIAEYEKTGRRVWTLTQNVDGFHRDAGSTNLIEIHGNVKTIECSRCSYTREQSSLRGLPDLPLCPECGKPLRPRVVLFGEMLPAPEVSALQKELSRGFDLIVSVGTSSVFPYISGPVYDAVSGGIPAIEINPGESSISRIVTLHVKAGAASALLRIKEEMLASGAWRS